MERYKNIPLHIGLVKDPSLEEPNHELIRETFINTPFFTFTTDIELISSSQIDVVIVSDFKKSPPLYLTTYLVKNRDKALVIIGPTDDNIACLHHVIAGAQDYFNCERFKSSLEGFYRCLRFAYERQKWINTLSC